MPETFVCLPGDLLVGARRNKPYACSADRGENWFEIEGLPSSLYQPSLQLLPDGSLACFGHIGGDLALGQADMYIAADFFRVEGRPPAAAELSLERLLSPEGEQYRNAYAATLTQDGRPLAGRRVVFRFNPYWRADGTVSTLPQEEAPHQIEAVTDSQGGPRPPSRTLTAPPTSTSPTRWTPASPGRRRCSPAAAPCGASWP